MRKKKRHFIKRKTKKKGILQVREFVKRYNGNHLTHSIRCGEPQGKEATVKVTKTNLYHRQILQDFEEGRKFKNKFVKHYSKSLKGAKQPETKKQKKVVDLK